MRETYSLVDAQFTNRVATSLKEHAKPTPPRAAD